VLLPVTASWCRSSAQQLRTVVALTTQQQRDAMTTYDSNFTHTHAVNLVHAALTSGSIKLLGSSANDDDNASNAKNDAQYLNSLITSLAKNLATMDL
jgi:hypothetical protein